MYKIFGREPAAVVGLIGAALIFLVSFGLPVDNEQVGLIVAAIEMVLGVFVAWRTRHTTLALVLSAAKALIALAAGFSLSLTAEQTGAILLVITMGAALFNRTQTSPAGVQPGSAAAEPGGSRNTADRRY